MGRRRWQGRGALMIAGLKLGRRNHAKLPVEPAVVEPVDVRQRGELHVVQPLPRPLVADQLGLVEAVCRFRVKVDPGFRRKADPPLALVTRYWS